MEKKHFLALIVVLGSAAFYTISSYSKIVAVGIIGLIVLFLAIYFAYFGRPICPQCKKRMSYSKAIQRGAPQKINFVCKNCSKEKTLEKRDMYRKANKFLGNDNPPERTK